MSRPQIDYLQSQTLPWQASPWAHLAGCQVKGLSRDAASGARSLLVRYPIHWRGPRGALSIDEEALVLEGALDRDGRRYAQDCYGWLPAGYRQTVRAAPEGAVALAFYGAEPTWTDGDARLGRPAAEPMLIDAFELPWMQNGVDPAFGGAGHGCKRLRDAPDGAAATMLIASPPHLRPPRWRAPQEIHECAEELFLLSGDFLSSAGQLCAGAYVWRPPRVVQGPYGSRGGNLALLRTHGAPLATDHSAHELALPRAPAYQPLLPAGLRALASYPWQPQRY